MSIRVYRVCRAIHAALDGRGAAEVGGRWNSPGRSVVYMSESVSLAVLENLVHMSKFDFPIGYVVVAARIPDEVVITTARPTATPEQTGNSWFHSKRSAVLKVPSAVITTESNYLLNPYHPDFRKIIVEDPFPFEFDPRLF